MILRYLIMCRSLTYAQRSAKTLENAGITAVVMKAPQGVSGSGCSYCVKVSERRLSQALQVLNAASLAPTKIFVQSDDGKIEEVKL